MITGKKYWGDGSPVSGQDFEYAFDDIGNRETTDGRESAESTYTSNRLNQYTQRTVADKVDVLGLANPTADVTVNNNEASRKGDYFHYALTVNNSSAAQYPTVTVTSEYGGEETSSGKVFVPKTPEAYTHDDDGNLTQDGRWELTSISSVTYGTGSASLPLSYTYAYNQANQRARRTDANGYYWIYQYDELGQVVSGRRYWSDGSEVLGQQFVYQFDDIGNREETDGRDSSDSTYTVNRLNQYTQRTVSSKVDIFGIANPTDDVTVKVSGGTAYTAARKGEYYHHALNVGNNVYSRVEVKYEYGSTETNHHQKRQVGFLRCISKQN